MRTLSTVVVWFLAFGALGVSAGCSSSDDSGSNNGAGGTATAGSAGSAGSGGTSGSAGSAGSGATAGSSGSAGSAGSAGGGAAGAGGSVGPAAGREPPGPGATKQGDGSRVVFAIDKLKLGTTDPNGAADSENGWKHYGYDVDHKISTATSTDLCKPAESATAAKTYPDGDEGIDNAWGHHVLPILLGLASDFETQSNDTISTGAMTTLFSIETLGVDAEYNPLHACVYNAAALGAPPKFDGSDAWPVTAESLNNPADIATCKSDFAASYLVNNVWVSGASDPAATLDLFIGSAESPIKLHIHQPVVTMTLDADRAGATDGTVSGVLDTEEVVSEMGKMLGAWDTSLCPPSPTADSVFTQIRQGSDILANGTQDSSKVCSGITIGFGFTAKKVVLGVVADPVPPPVDPCSSP